MSKTAKTLLGLTVSGLVLVGIAIWLLASNLDGIVKRVVEDVGSETLGTQVSLSSAEIKLADAKATLGGLKIANPPGFKADSAFELGGISVTLDPTTVTGNEIVMPSVIINEAALTFEQTGSDNNLKALLDNLASDSDQAAADGTETTDSEMLIVIEELQLNGASMTLIADQLSKPLNLTLADITLRDIGKRGAGVTPEQAVEQIIQPILKRAEDTAKDRVKDELKERARDKVSAEKDKLLDSAKKKLFGD